ncbi:MAG: nucleotidyltransferase [Boseongicola sp.]|nr:nucleotidyltransferase [Boseongicola sp.]MDD9978236.1 nucleotidyltransferase [Boseongicola sp.]
MTKQISNHIEFLDAMADAIDIPTKLHEKAIDRYNSIGEYFQRPTSGIFDRDPVTYPQGSFLLGTVIRPVGDADEFDLDIVCQVQGSDNELTQEELKQLVGIEVNDYASANGIAKSPKDGRRCWTIEYSKSEKFHMDILPALPNAHRYREFLIEKGHVGLGADVELTENALAITDKEHENYASITNDWLISNPRGYAAWFRQQQSAEFDRRKSLLVEDRQFASVDEVPDYRVKTPLQRAIQLLKRHRDTMYGDDPDKPISIIITTLSAQAYSGEQNIGDALRTILTDMDKHIADEGSVRYVRNPVNPEENFADKWEEFPAREKEFHRWLKAAQTDFSHYFRRPYDSVPSDLVERLTQNTFDKVSPLMALASPTVVSPKEVASKEVDYITEHGGNSKPWQG